MEKWFVTTKRADFNTIAEQFHISPILARIIRNREITGEQAVEYYLNGTVKDLHNAAAMKDIEKAALLLKSKIEEGKKIRVIGDYDIDGIQSSYILLKAFERCKADADIAIPDRMKDGYGLNERLIRKAYEEKIDTIVTCDNGIAAAAEVDLAIELGMTVIITDHHEVPYEEKDGIRIYRVPNAHAVVNPKQEDCKYPFKGLCGAGVAYKLAGVLYEVCEVPKEEILEFLEFAAIATIGDVMDLVDENRILVKEGLRRLRCTKNIGLKALMDVNGIAADQLSAYHIGFVLGPCMNASGRLDTALRALELLCSKNELEAYKTAGDLKSLNDSRKGMTLEGTQQAIEQIENTGLKDDKVLVVYLPECHESLAGIIAGRIREKFHKPVFVLTRGEEGVKGSGRSIEAYSMYEEMTRCKELFLKYGGHKMAAGLSLLEENIDVFRKTINDLCKLTDEDFIEKVSIDVPMPIHYVSESLIEELELLEPFGKGNEKPVFAEKNLKVISACVLGKNKNVLKLFLKNETGVQMEAVMFRNIELFEQRLREAFGTEETEAVYRGKGTNARISAAYYPVLNEYNGNKKLQINILNWFVNG